MSLQEPAWKQAFRRHEELLNEHKRILEEIHKDVSLPSQVQKVAAKCVQNTYAMLDTVKHFNAEVPINIVQNTGKQQKRVLPEESSDEPKGRKKQKRADSEDKNGTFQGQPSNGATTADPNAFFVIDSKPADVDSLLNSFNTQKSRKRALPHQGSMQEGHIDAGDNLEEVEPRKKRQKAEHFFDARETHNEVEVKQEPDIDTYKQKFEAKVELRLKEKEELRKKKALKKRKRDSDMSVDDLLDAYDSGRADHTAELPHMSGELKKDLRRTKKRQAIKIEPEDPSNGTHAMAHTHDDQGEKAEGLYAREGRSEEMKTSSEQNLGRRKEGVECISVIEGRRLYIGNIDYATTGTDLKNFFSNYNVESTEIAINPRRNRPCGYAFAVMKTADDAQKAVRDLSGKELLERELLVQLARNPLVGSKATR